MRLIAGALALLLPSLALAQPSCAPVEKVHQLLARKFGEHPVGIGTTPAGAIEIFARADGGTWTLILVRPDGLACLMADGTHWLKAKAPSEGT